MQVYALTSSQSLHEPLDLFLTREAGAAEPREILEDEPDWQDVLRVVPIELDGPNVSANWESRPGRSRVNCSVHDRIRTSASLFRSMRIRAEFVTLLR